MTKEAVDHYEKVRADWLLAHEASWHMSDRRMANDLKRRAAQRDRSSSGAAESSHHEGRIKPIASRFVAAGEDSKESMARGCFLVLFLIPALAISLGPALAFSRVAYGVASESQLKKGQVPTRAPWLVAAGVLAAAGAVAGLLVRSLLIVATVSFYPVWVIDVHWTNLGIVYGWAQLVMGLVLTAWQIRRHGWPGVTIKRAPKTPVIPVAPDLPRPPAVPDGARAAAERPIGTPSNAVEAATKTSAPRVVKAPALPLISGPDEWTEDEDEPVFDEEDLVVVDDSAR